MSLRNLLLLSVVVNGLLFGTSNLFAQSSQSVNLAWDASPSPSIASYVVRYGNTSGAYAYSTNVGSQTAVRITGLQAGLTYFFAVAARDNSGVESVPSNEVSYQVPASNPPPAIALTSPVSGASYAAPASLNLSASVTANGHTITKVQFYNGAALIGEDTSPPYNYTWSGVSAGSYSLTARLVYYAGSTLNSAVANVTITTLPQETTFGLVAAYSFNEGAGTTVTDVSGKGNNGISDGVTWTTQGKYGSALSFNGSSQVVVPDSNSLDLTNGMTLEAWVFPTVQLTSWSTVLAKEQGDGVAYLLDAASPSGPPVAFIYGGDYSILTGPSALAANSWCHLAATYDSSTLRLYVNGTQVASQAYASSIVASSGVLSMGGNVWGEFFQGAIDEVRIYNRALSASELQTDMSTPVTPVANPPPIVALTSPLAGASYSAPANINCAASVTANGHTITKVQFFNGATLVGEDTSAPYNFSWNNASAGNFALKARVVYDAGSTLDSATVNVTVTNPPPTIALTSPANGASYTSPAVINCGASVTPNGHTISKVQFFNGTALVGEDVSAPYNYSWNGVSSGTYTVKARAVYDSGSTVDSATVNLTVTGLPAPWQSVDLGATGVAGSASHSNGFFTVKGVGKISGTADSFRFVYQPLSGDGEIKARLNSISANGTNRVVGLMIRESLAPNAKYAFMGMEQNLKFRWQRRSSTGGSTSSTTSGTGTPPNTWLRMVRSGKTLYGYKSADGVNWTRVSSPNITMATNIYVGLVVTSGDTNTLNTSVFSTMTVVP